MRGVWHGHLISVRSTPAEDEDHNDVMRPQYDASDADYERRVRDSFAEQGAMRTLGIELVDLGPGWVELGLKNSAAIDQQDGFIHAGVLTAALDSACGYAAFALMPADARVLTVEYKVNLLRPASDEEYVARGWVVKPGRTLTVCQGVVEPPGGGKPVAMMTATMMTVLD